MNTEKQIVDEIIQFFNENLSSDYNIQQEVPFSSSIGSNTRRLRFDFMITKEGSKTPIMLGEVKNQYVTIEKSIDYYFNLFSKTSTQYGIFIDLVNVYLVDYSDTTEKPYKIQSKGPWDSCKTEIVKLIKKVSPELTIQKFLDAFKVNFKEIEKGCVEGPRDENIKKLELNKFFENLRSKDLVRKDSSFKFTSKKEDELFSILFPSSTENIFCRYVSFESLFRTLKGKKWTMAGLVGMNDKSETFFIESLLNNNYPIRLDTKSENEIKRLNSFFINSLSPKELSDSLMMWRYYGNDGKGVCLHFKLKENIYKGFQLKKIQYVDENSFYSIFFKWLINFGIGNVKFQLNKIDVWQHFLKPTCFQEEKEIRLLFDSDKNKNQIFEKKWILNPSYGLIHPLIMFSFTSKLYPFDLEKIILGPKLPEQDINMAQIKVLLEKSKLKNIPIEYSQQNFYR